MCHSKHIHPIPVADLKFLFFCLSVLLFFFIFLGGRAIICSQRPPTFSNGILRRFGKGSSAPLAIIYFFKLTMFGCILFLRFFNVTPPPPQHFVIFITKYKGPNHPLRSATAYPQGAGRSSEVECSLMVQWVVRSILHGVDPLSYFSFQPVLHDWCNKGYPVCGMVHIKEPLLLIDKSSLCGGSGYPFSLSENGP